MDDNLAAFLARFSGLHQKLARFAGLESERFSEGIELFWNYQLDDASGVGCEHDAGQNLPAITTGSIFLIPFSLSISHTYHSLWFMLL